MGGNFSLLRSSWPRHYGCTALQYLDSSKISLCLNFNTLFADASVHHNLDEERRSLASSACHRLRWHPPHQQPSEIWLGHLRLHRFQHVQHWSTVCLTAGRRRLVSRSSERHSSLTRTFHKTDRESLSLVACRCFMWHFVNFNTESTNH